MAICSQGTVEGGTACAMFARYAPRVLRAPVRYLQLFVTQAREKGYLGGKTTEPSISSSEATGSNKSIVMPDPESLSFATSCQFGSPRICNANGDLLRATAARMNRAAS